MKMLRNLREKLAGPSKNVINRVAGGKKGMFSCCKRHFEKIGADLAAHIHIENVKKKLKIGGFAQMI